MKYLFVGNRMDVLNEMLLLGLDVDIVPIPANRELLVNDIMSRKYDILVSNGCPYTLPISKMGNHIFVNIHPSLLPDLKGKSPILEALKQNKPMGVTCHVMIDEVDSGDIISQVKVFPDRSDLNDCYKKMFKAEARAFKLALDRNFKPI